MDKTKPNDAHDVIPGSLLPVSSEKRSSPQFSVNLSEEDQAKRLLAITISRQASRFVVNATTTRVKLSEGALADGIKSRIVGKEGRNARHFEERSGVDLLLNDEPDSIVISSFDPFRREVARLALESLVRDGRIHPASIEDFLSEAKIQAEASVKEAAHRALSELGIENVHPAIARVLGTLKYRTSFGQNQLEHSVETAWFCGNLANEMGLDVQLARRAGLFHDLGKALGPDKIGGHAESGGDFARKYGESDWVAHAIAAHHEEIPAMTWLDHLLIAADALSGARPGARHGSTQNALDRATAMEKIAREVPGVLEAYAVRAGRELRVFVDCAQVDDIQTGLIAKMIAERIEAEVRFPGQIKVTALRELRATEVAVK